MTAINRRDPKLLSIFPKPVIVKAIGVCGFARRVATPMEPFRAICMPEATGVGVSTTCVLLHRAHESGDESDVKSIDARAFNVLPKPHGALPARVHDCSALHD